MSDIRTEMEHLAAIKRAAFKKKEENLELFCDKNKRKA